ncbi:6-phosphogluconolactonase [Bacteroidota bacterium]
MQPKVNIYQDQDEFAVNFTKKLVKLIETTIHENDACNIMLSGGRTPNFIYKYLASNFEKSIKWESVHFFWGDERCVPSDYPDSNFGEASKNLLKQINIPLTNIHPIVGESHPYLEADRYSTLMHKHFNVTNSIPSFDIIILGLGTDGHVASLFPDQLDIFNSNRLFEVTSHPDTGQQRITVTGKIINSAANIYFLVTGKNKAEVIRQILNKENKASKFPASMVNPELGNIQWFLDKEAAELL